MPRLKQEPVATMFDILVYLFENYYTPEACPSAEVLAKRLAAAGFDPVAEAAALRRAQRAVMREHPHPLYWAAFVLYGGW